MTETVGTGAGSAAGKKSEATGGLKVQRVDEDRPDREQDQSGQEHQESCS